MQTRQNLFIWSSSILVNRSFDTKRSEKNEIDVKSDSDQLQNITTSFDRDRRWKAFKKKLKRSIDYLIKIVANGGSFLYGISLGWSSTSEPEVLSPNYTFKMTEKEFSWSVSTMCLGAAMSCVISGIIRNHFGTKKTIFVFAVPNILGWLLITFAWNSIMVSKIILFE